mgnify:FL=1
MPHIYPEITSPPLRRRMAEALNNLRRNWLLKCSRWKCDPVVRRDIVRWGIHEMARLEQALDDEQDKIREEYMMDDYDDHRADEESRRAEADEDIGSVVEVLRANRARADMEMEGTTRTGMLHPARAYAIDQARREQQIAQAIGAMLNAEVTLQSIRDNSQIPSMIQRQARRDALALSEAIALLKGNQS